MNSDVSRAPSRISLRHLWKKAVAVPAIVATIVVLGADVGTVWRWIFPPADSAEISYARMYGAFQVPAIMFRSTWLPGGVVPPDSLSQETVIGGLPDFRSTLLQWESSPLKGASFALGPVGESISSAFREYKGRLDDPISRLALPDDSLKNRYRFLEPWMMGMTEEEIQHVQAGLPPFDPEDRGPVVDLIEGQIQRASEQVGYLFLSVENLDGEETLTNVRLHYALYPVGEYGKQCLPSDDRITPAGVAPKSAALTLPSIKPKGVLLLPLAVFRTDEARFPAAFCSSVIAPSRLNWTEAGRQRHRDITSPSLAGGAREILPFDLGWYHQ